MVIWFNLIWQSWWFNLIEEDNNDGDLAKHSVQQDIHAADDASRALRLHAQSHDDDDVDDDDDGGDGDDDEYDDDDQCDDDDDDADHANRLRHWEWFLYRPLDGEASRQSLPGFPSPPDHHFLTFFTFFLVFFSCFLSLSQ